MARPGTTCVCDGCSAPAVDFKHFPTIAGYCVEHGGVVADFLSLVNAPGVIGLDAARDRWRRGFNLLRS